MKTKNALFITFITFVIISCANNKNFDDDQLYNSTWQLEYISGPRIAFNGLYPHKKPEITFDKATKKVAGNNGCNGYSADFTLTDNSISFGEPGPSTMMFCGEGESVFMDMINKINKYNFDEEGKLNLMIDDVSVMRFKKIN